jgi:hypothetical protein
VRTVGKNLDAIHKNMSYAGRELMRVVIRSQVTDCCRIKDDYVGIVTGRKQSATCQLQVPGRE